MPIANASGPEQAEQNSYCDTRNNGPAKWPPIQVVPKRYRNKARQEAREWNEEIGELYTI